MALNLDLTKANTKRVSLGTGRLFVAAHPGGSSGGTTPTAATHDVGLGRGGSLNITRTKTELMAGVPKQLVLQLATQEDVTLSFNSVEWRPKQLQYVLGYTDSYFTTGTPADTDTLEFGGIMSFKDLCVRFQHEMANGGTLFLDIYKAQGQGEVALNFGDDFHEIPYAFKALSSTTTWDGRSTASNGVGAYCRMQIFLPAGLTPGNT